jgi:hypothetical protein
MKSEGARYEFIKTQIVSDCQYSALLEFVHFDYLSVGCLRNVGELISHSFGIFTIGIWNAVLPQLLMSAPRLRFLPRFEDCSLSEPQVFSRSLTKLVLHDLLNNLG